MEEVPDMDDLLDEMESDLMRKARVSQAPPLLPPTSIGMQPRGFHQNPPTKSVFSVSKFVPGEEMNEQMEGHINIDTSHLPNTFQPKRAIWEKREVVEEPKEVVPPPKSNGVHQPPPPVPEAVIVPPEVPSKVAEVVKEEEHSEPEPEELSEAEEDTLIPETQVISNLNATDRDVQFPPKQPTSLVAIEQPQNNIPVDSEMESMMDYLNGFDDPATVVENNEGRKKGGRESFSESADDSVVSQFAEKFSEDLVESALKNKKLHYDPAIKEFYTANDSAPDVFAISMNETQSSANLDSEAETGNYLSEPENGEGKGKERMPSVVEEEEEEENGEDVKQVGRKEEEVPEAEIHDMGPEIIVTEAPEDDIVPEEPVAEPEVPQPEETIDTASNASEDVQEQPSPVSVEVDEPVENNEVPEEVEAPKTPEVAVVEDEPEKAVTSEQPAEEIKEKKNEVEEEKEVVEISEQIVNEDAPEVPESPIPEVPVFVEPSVVEAVRREEDITTVEVADVAESNESCETETDADAESETRPRFDSTIADVHVLHESDSDDVEAPRRERRLTESELQLGKTPPYWIPDSECLLCMLCNTKFTIITRRHHCRACGRVLCGSCCSEKAMLEYLQEEGKKPQTVRVCKPCSAMLSRIETHEQEEKRRRESVTSENADDADESAASSSVPAPIVPVVPRGVLKSRTLTQSNEEDGASTSQPVVVAPETSRRSVMFRDGVRPGAPADEANPEDERSTALKPKKKTRKRHSVVKRIAELKMEEELFPLISPEIPKVQVQKPDQELPVYENALAVLEQLCNFSVVTIVIKKNLKCSVQIFNNPNFGLVWVVSTQGFAQIGLDELLFSWTLSAEEKEIIEGDAPEFNDQVALGYLPLAVFRRISNMFQRSTDQEFAGVRRVCERHPRVYSALAEHPLPTHILLFRPTVQAGLENMRLPESPFLIACFLHDDELSWATAMPNRLLYKLGEKYNVFPTPFVNPVGRPALYSTDFSGTVLKVFTDFRSWSYRMRTVPGCTVSLTNDKTIIRIPKSALSDLKEVLSFSRSMVAWICELNHQDDSILICEETDPGLYSTQVFAKNIGQRESTSASFVILDGGSKVNALQVNVVEDGVSIRLQSERLETILNAINDGHDVVETSKDMEFRVEFVEDGDWLSHDIDYYPKSQIDQLYLMNKFQYGLSLERVLTQTLQIASIPEHEVRLSHVYNLGEGRLTPEEEPRIYGMVEIAARECVAMLEPHARLLIASGIWSVSIRLYVTQYEFEYDVSKWTGLEKENVKYRQSLDTLIPMLYNMIEFVPGGFEVEFVLSFVNTKSIRS